MYLCVVGVIFRWQGGWRPVSHGVWEMLGLGVLRTVGDKVLLTIVLYGLRCMSDVGGYVL